MARRWLERYPNEEDCPRDLDTCARIWERLREDIADKIAEHDRQRRRPPQRQAIETCEESDEEYLQEEEDEEELEEEDDEDEPVVCFLIPECFFSVVMSA